MFGVKTAAVPGIKIADQAPLSEPTGWAAAAQVSLGSGAYFRKWKVSPVSRIPVFSVVGYSGTGKTTFLERLIPILKAKGLRIAVIKHDAHEFEIDKEGKDSWRMTQAGADVTGLISDTKAVLMENRPIPVQRLIDQIQDVDVIFTEGYKHGSWPKILLHAKRTGKPLPIDPDTCIAVCTDEAIETRAPRYSLEETQAVAELIYGRLLAQEPAFWAE